MSSGHSSRKFSLVWAACAATALLVLTLMPIRSPDAIAWGALNEEDSASLLHHQWEDLLGNRIRNTNTGSVGIGVSPGLPSPFWQLDVRTSSSRAVSGLNQAQAGAGRYGVWGQTFSTEGTGTLGYASVADAGRSNGIWGWSEATSGRGVYGVAPGTQGRGVFGWATSTDGVTTGVYGLSHSTSGRGVVGVNEAATGATRAVIGQVHSNNSGAVGVWGIARSPAWAVFATGRFGASGTKSFQIDHPIDPANKWLLHYATEAPEPLNAYSGNVVLDRNGAAWVGLPEWFESINRDFRYQLTSIGAPGPNLHVAREIVNNAFLIAGGVPGSKVSWRVEAVRDDLYVRQYGAPVEIEKPAEARGLYLHPELYGQPPDRALHYVPLDPEPVAEMREIRGLDEVTLGTDH